MEEEAVLKFYTNTSYYKFNQAAIKGISESDIIEIDRLLRNTLDRLKSSPGTYYRGIGKEEIAFLDSYKKGDIITYKNFMSTTSDELVSANFIRNNIIKTGEGALVVIQAKNAKSIKKFSDAEKEIEYLLKSRTEYEIIDIKPNVVINSLEVFLEGREPINGTIYYLKEL
ncbi:MAG: ADP-ribosyltransferase [Myroides sp.]|nr:ADP-ribosyltransferase [Myroides sp.]